MDYLFGFVPQQASFPLAENIALGAEFRAKPLCWWETLAESDLASFVIFALCEGSVPATNEAISPGTPALRNRRTVTGIVPMLLSEVNATTPAGKNALKKWIGFNFVSVKRQEEYGFRTNTL